MARPACLLPVQLPTQDGAQTTGLRRAGVEEVLTVEMVAHRHRTAARKIMDKMVCSIGASWPAFLLAAMQPGP